MREEAVRHVAAEARVEACVEASVEACVEAPLLRDAAVESDSLIRWACSAIVSTCRPSVGGRVTEARDGCSSRSDGIE